MIIVNEFQRHKEWNTLFAVATVVKRTVIVNGLQKLITLKSRLPDTWLTDKQNFVRAFLRDLGGAR